jgi:acyl carrier protein
VTRTDDGIEERRRVLDELRRLLVEQLRVEREPDEIDPDTPLFGTGLGLDSVDAVELVVSVETAFGIQVPDGPAARSAMRTVSTLADHVLRAKREFA